MIFWFKRILILPVSLGMAGCAAAPKNAGFPDVEKMVRQRAGKEVHWNEAPAAEAAMNQALQTLLKEELTVDKAVQVALLNNRSLQATFEELGIARADLIQAGLLKNPVFSGHARFPEGSGQTNVELALGEEILDVLFIPLRKKLARAQFEKAKIQVSDAVLNLITEVKRAYYNFQAAGQVKGMQESALQAAQAAQELAANQFKAGNINQLQLSNEQAAYQQAQVEFLRSDADFITERETLSQLLGLSEEETKSWKITAQLPELLPADLPLDVLETLAMNQRLDLAAARKEIEVFERALSLARVGVIPSPEVSIDTEVEPGGDRVTGPDWNVALPIFDHRQADKARAQAQIRQSRNRLAALEVKARSEVRAAKGKMAISREIALRFRESLVPLRKRIIDLSLEHYNFMLIGAYQILQAKQNEIAAAREYSEAMRDYWVARAELERAVGGKLPTGNLAFADTASATPMPTPAQNKNQETEPMQHHHHGGKGS